MAATDGSTTGELYVGRLINRTFGVLKRNLLTFLILALLFSGLPTALYQYLLLDSVSRPGAPATVFGSVGSFLVLLLVWPLLQGALIHGTVADLNKRRASLADCLATGLRHLLPLLAIAVLMTIALALGFLLFIVPAVLMALAWAVVAPVRVVEKKGIFESFGRSAQLTRNMRWKILGLYVLSWLFNWGVGLFVQVLFGGLLSMAPGPSWVSTVVVQLAASSIGAMVGSTGIAVLYFELRRVKEGVGVEQLASVFD